MRVRLAGARWRIKADVYDGRGRFGDTWHVASDRRFGGGDGRDREVDHNGRTYHVRHVELCGTELDEVVVGRFLHLEAMDTGTYWLDVAGVVIWIRADRDGRPLSVTVSGPDEDGMRVNGCKYSVTWTEREAG